MAGVTNTGISGCICNDNVRKFPTNAITIDILGNVFYINYEFGASDDVGVFWNTSKQLNKSVMLFLAASIQKALVGRFDFGKKFRASQSFDFYVSLPVLPLDSTKAESCPQRESGNREEGGSSTSADLELEADKRGSPLSPEKAAAFSNPQYDTHNIDFVFMESFIKEIEKEHFLSLIKYYHKLMSAYNEVLDSNLKPTNVGGGALSFKLEEYLSFYESYKDSKRAESVIASEIKQSIKDISCSFNMTKNSHSEALAEESKNDTTQIQWKQFCFDEIFAYERGKRYKKADHTSGKIPYISSSAFNNGIDDYVSPPSYMKIYTNKLTLANSGSVGTCFYHPYSFVASDHCMVIWLKNRELNTHTALFLRAIFEKLKPKYAFDKEINNARLRAEKFTLPIYANDEIAFEYIESFIKALQKEAIKSANLYRVRKESL